MVDMIGNRSVRDLLDERRKRYPERRCLVVEELDGALRTFTYRELVESVETVAAAFEGIGVVRGDTVVMKMPNSAEFVLTWLGLAWLGAVAVPVNVANTATEMSHVFAVSGARVFVADPDEVRATREDPSGSTISTWVTTRGGDTGHDVAAWLAAGSRTPLVGEAPGPDDLAQLIFTSGTTSLSKAVMLTHGNYLFSGEREARTLFLDESDVLLTALPLFHVNAQSITLLAALTVGATAVILCEYRASKFWQQVREHGATQISLVAMQVRTLLAQPEQESDDHHRIRRNIYAINVSDAEKDRFEERYGLELVNGYGLSEAMTVVTAAPVFGEKRWPSIGLPVPGREVRIVDLTGEEVPAGEVGEIIVRGVPGRSLMAGYYADPEATADALRGEWLHTGDNGRVDEKGYIYFVDRAKDVIKRAGENISSSEVETVLATHLAVKEVAVIGVPDPIRDEAVKAFIVLEDGATVDAAELTAHAQASLARFKVPTEYEFIAAMPKTSIGKIQKKELRRRTEGGASA